MIEYWERLKLAMDAKSKRDGSPYDITKLSLEMDLSYQAVAKVKNGGAFGKDNNIKAAKLLGVKSEWLATGDGSMWLTTGPDPDFVPVRHADVSFSNGTGQVVYHESDRPPLMFRADFLRKLGIAPGDAVVVDADGRSNEPRIVDGSVVLINRGDRELLDGDFFAFRYDGELMIKRLQTLPDVGILATAENINFKPKQKVYKDLQPDVFEVIGRAVWMGAIL